MYETGWLSGPLVAAGSLSVPSRQTRNRDFAHEFRHGKANLRNQVIGCRTSVWLENHADLPASRKSSRMEIQS